MEELGGQWKEDADQITMGRFGRMPDRGPPLAGDADDNWLWSGGGIGR